jgi:hypothetical protein
LILKDLGKEISRFDTPTGYGGVGGK